jgi:hypothetical protein
LGGGGGHIAKMNHFRGHVSRHSRILHKNLKTMYVRVTQIMIEELIRDTEKENCRQNRLWVREWISKRGSRVVSALLLKELYLEGPKKFRLCLRLTSKKFESLLELISPFIHDFKPFQIWSVHIFSTHSRF